ncbi:DNA-binding protein [Paraclostridium sordellii 8483]|nr:DNA-binding protein [Paeniclostridium sordellii 8483]
MRINEKKFQKMNTTMLGETAYLLKHIENNTGIKVSKLRRDIGKGKLKAYKNCGMYYVIQSDLDKYLNIK